MLGLGFLLRSHNPDLEFITPITIDECKSRLMKELNLKSITLGLHPSHPVIEQISDNRFLISRNQSFPLRDNYHPLLEGCLTATKDGTLVSGSFWINNGSILAALALGSSVFFGMAVYQVVFQGAEFGLLLVPIIFCGLFGLVVWFISRSDKSKKEVLANYLHSILDSEDNINVSQ